MNVAIISIVVVVIVSMVVFLNMGNQHSPQNSESVQSPNQNGSTQAVSTDEKDADFSDSEELNEILVEIQEKAGDYGIEVTMQDLKSYYAKGAGMISISNLTIEKAKKYNIPIPEKMEMTDDEFEAKKRHKCLYDDDGWQYLDKLPRTHEGISECWSQHYGYGRGHDMGTQIMFQAAYRKSWNSKKWDSDRDRWMRFTKAEEIVARGHSIEAKAREVAKRLEDEDNDGLFQSQSQDLLATGEEQLDELIQELETFSKDQIAHLEKSRKYNQFNDDDRAILKIERKIRSAKKKVKHAIIYEYKGRIRNIGFYEFLERKGIEL